MERVAGIDEAGRGALAGPVIAAAVVLDPRFPIPGLADSKLLTAGRREQLAHTIRRQALAWAIGRAEAREVDRLNVLQASLLAMQRAFSGLTLKPDRFIVDGKQLPDLPVPGEAVVKADQTVAAVSAASILAKVARDQEMRILAALLPDYGFGQHKGYATRQHRAILSRVGVSSVHRTSYAPVRTVAEAKESVIQPAADAVPA